VTSKYKKHNHNDGHDELLAQLQYWLKKAYSRHCTYE